MLLSSFDDSLICKFPSKWVLDLNSPCFPSLFSDYLPIIEFSWPPVFIPLPVYWINWVCLPLFIWVVHSPALISLLKAAALYSRSISHLLFRSLLTLRAVLLQSYIANCLCLFSDLFLNHRFLAFKERFIVLILLFLLINHFDSLTKEGEGDK